MVILNWLWQPCHVSERNSIMKRMYKQRFGCVNVITSVDFSVVSFFIFLTSESKPLDENKESERKSENKIHDRVRYAANELRKKDKMRKR